jgi:hypothetical protein
MFDVLRLEDWRDTRQVRHSAEPLAASGAGRGVVVGAVIGLVLWALMIVASWLWWT